ncbi:hypothetical protein DMUE_3545 [Dictyocoela muelleri]|nr:hypothetical protein DMUE_3545 [Dictyocoela muelleri]
MKHILTSPHNPTGNSIFEKINAIILQVCRMSKGSKINDLEQKIRVRPNAIPSTVTRLSPINLQKIVRKNNLNTQGIQFNKTLDISQKQADNKRINNKRLN